MNPTASIALQPVLNNHGSPQTSPPPPSTSPSVTTQNALRLFLRKMKPRLELFQRSTRKSDFWKYLLGVALAVIGTAYTISSWYYGKESYQVAVQSYNLDLQGTQHSPTDLLLVQTCIEFQDHPIVRQSGLCNGVTLQDEFRLRGMFRNFSNLWYEDIAVYGGQFQDLPFYENFPDLRDVPLTWDQHLRYHIDIRGRHDNHIKNRWSRQVTDTNSHLAFQTLSAWWQPFDSGDIPITRFVLVKSEHGPDTVNCKARPGRCTMWKLMTAHDFFSSRTITHAWDWPAWGLITSSFGRENMLGSTVPVIHTGLWSWPSSSSSNPSVSIYPARKASLTSIDQLSTSTVTFTFQSARTWYWAERTQSTFERDPRSDRLHGRGSHCHGTKLVKVCEELGNINIAGLTWDEENELICGEKEGCFYTGF